MILIQYNKNEAGLYFFNIPSAGPAQGNNFAFQINNHLDEPFVFVDSQEEFIDAAVKDVRWDENQRKVLRDAIDDFVAEKTLEDLLWGSELLLLVDEPPLGQQIIPDFEKNRQRILEVWSGSAEVRDWFCGKPRTVHQEGQAHNISISLTSLISNFKRVLQSRTNIPIEAIWNSNLGLQAYFSGNPINFGWCA